MKFKYLLMCLLFVLSAYTIPSAHALDLTGYDTYMFSEPEKTISMDFRDADLNNVLKIFSQQSGLNFIASSDVAEIQVNLYLDNVPVEAALERILSANNLTYELNTDSNIFVVKKLNIPEIEIHTRVYQLKHASVSGSKLNSTFSSDSSDSSTETSSAGGESSSGLLEAVTSVLSSSGSITEDSRTNSLIVNDIPERFPYIEKTIARLDVRIPLILIEVEMLDISKNASDFLGVKFGQTPVTFSGASKTLLAPFQSDNNNGDIAYSTGTLSFSGLAFALDFLKKETDAQSLARPRIMTLNNETAEIKITTDEVVGVTSTEDSDNPSDTTFEAERAETGVSLIVTPQANLKSGEITMAIQPKVIESSVSPLNGSFSDLEERSVKTLLRVNNGDTIVIGGLLRTESNDSRTNVPIISKIPVVGTMFRHKDKSESQRELVVFITPHIVKDTLANHKIRKPFIRERSAPNKGNAINNDLTHFQQRKF
ncbi:MAG: type IV pilus assembly protein PilQ [Candidatus Omnitrophota bacterium]|jgi:type IV pilus assembly protein PilQ